MFIKGEATQARPSPFCCQPRFPAMIASVSLVHPAGAGRVSLVPVGHHVHHPIISLFQRTQKIRQHRGGLRARVVKQNVAAPGFLQALER